MPDAVSPERKSYAPTLVFGAGTALVGLSWFFGVGAAVTGVNGAAAAIGTGIVVMVGAAILGAILMIVGGVWMIVRVIADQTENPEEKRYRNVER